MEEGKIKSYRDLKVWQQGMLLVKSIFAFSKGFPEKEQFGLTVQIRSSAVSVPANIAEGWGRGKNKHFGNHLRIARGSLNELETHYLIPAELGFGQRQEILNKTEVLSKMLNALLLKIELQTDTEKKLTSALSPDYSSPITHHRSL